MGLEGKRTSVGFIPSRWHFPLSYIASSFPFVNWPAHFLPPLLVLVADWRIGLHRFSKVCCFFLTPVGLNLLCTVCVGLRMGNGVFRAPPFVLGPTTCWAGRGFSVSPLGGRRFSVFFFWGGGRARCSPVREGLCLAKCVFFATTANGLYVVLAKFSSFFPPYVVFVIFSDFSGTFFLCSRTEAYIFLPNPVRDPAPLFLFPQLLFTTSFNGAPLIQPHVIGSFLLSLASPHIQVVHTVLSPPSPPTRCRRIHIWIWCPFHATAKFESGMRDFRSSPSPLRIFLLPGRGGGRLSPAFLQLLECLYPYLGVPDSPVGVQRRCRVPYQAYTAGCNIAPPVTF